MIGDHTERGKQGKVLQVLRKTDQVLVEGVNIQPHEIKGDPERGIEGRTVDKESAIPYSKVNLVDPVTNKPTRITYSILEDGTKVRVSKKSGAVIPRPEILLYRKRPISNIITDSDTTEDDVWEITYEDYKVETPPSAQSS